jgi:hypothetical protein
MAPDSLADVEAFNREAHALFEAYLEGHSDELHTVDLGLAAFMCMTTIEALSHRAVLHSPEKLSDEAVRTLVDEATRLVVRYLQNTLTLVRMAEVGAR